MKKILFSVFIATATVAAVSAQETTTGENLNRQMDVVRAYEPTVDRAVKIDIAPNMVDTVNLRPEIDYMINYNPVRYRFDVSPINPAKVNIRNQNTYGPLYAKVGFGYPFQSLADVYAATTDKGRGYIGAFANHYGSWSKIGEYLVGDIAYETPASYTFNTGGIHGEYRFDRYAVGGELAYDYDMVTRYGGTQVAPNTNYSSTAEALRQHYSTFGGNVYFGNAFEDLSYFNFRIGLNGSVMKDKRDHGQNSFGGTIDLGKAFGDVNAVTLHAGYSGSRGSDRLKFEEDIINVTPLYHRRGDVLDLKVGVDYWYTKNDFENKHLIAPHVDIKLNLANGYFVPFLTASGDVRSNDYLSLAKLNPYIEQGLVMPSTEEYNARAGITGLITSSVSYTVYAGYSRYESLNMFANYFSGTTRYGETFISVMDGADMFTVGGDIEGRLTGKFSAKLAFQYLGYDMDNLDKPIGMPDMKGSLDLKYTHGNKFSITAGAHLTGQRHFLDYDVSSPDFGALYKQDAVVDVRLGGEVKLLPYLDLFIDGRNLLNQDLYQYSRYIGLGINAMAGIKFTF